MDKVQHFEIPADDMDRVKKFYGDVFGWRLMDAPGMKDYTMAYTVEVDEKYMAKEPNAINGGITKRDPVAPSPVIAITVSSMEAALAKIKAAGGTVLGDVKPIANMGLYAYAKDTEGNVIGVWQNLK